MLALICTLGIPAMAGIPSVHLLCKSHGGHINEGCILVNSQGVRLSRELFDTHQDTITDGMMRTFANIGTASGGYDWRYGFINIQGKVVVPPIYKEASKFSSGLAWVMTAHGAAYIDTQGRVALQLSPQWVDAHDFHHGLALVRGKGYMIGTHPMSSIGPMRVAPPWSVIDKTGRIVMGYDPRKDTSPATGGYIAPAIDILSDFIDGKAVFRRSLSSGDRFSNELGLIDTQGRVVQEPSKKHWHESSLRELDSFTSASQKPSASLSKRFYVVDDFHEGLAWAIDASKDKKGEMHYKTQGFVDQRGRWIFKVDEQTLPVRPFHQGHAIVLINEYKINQGQTEALIDSTGRVVANYRLLVGEIRR
jgi:WG containing repeat